MTSYLSNRGPWPFSVPQGSILGPILFIIFTNDLPSSLSKAECIMYADDSTSVVSHKNYEEAVRLNCEAEEQMSNWMINNRLTLNADKTVKMTLTLRNYHDTTNAAVARMLGVQVDPTLSWGPHCVKLAAALSSTVYLLRSLSKCVSKDILVTAYYGLFHSKMIYAISAWGHSPHTQAVFRVQRRAIRILAGKGYREDCRADFSNLRIPTLFSVYAYKCATFAFDNRGGLLVEPQHEHSTRFASQGNLQHIFKRLYKGRHCANHWAVRIYNSLPEDIKNMNRTLFKKNVKNHFLEKNLYALDET